MAQKMVIIPWFEQLLMNFNVMTALEIVTKERKDSPRWRGARPPPIPKQAKEV